MPVAVLAIALVLAGWSTRTAGDTFHIFATEWERRDASRRKSRSATANAELRTICGIAIQCPETQSAAVVEKPRFAPFHFDPAAQVEEVEVHL
jgi:hypothetical protein